MDVRSAQGHRVYWYLGASHPHLGGYVLQELYYNVEWEPMGSFLNEEVHGNAREVFCKLSDLPPPEPPRAKPVVFFDVVVGDDDSKSTICPLCWPANRHVQSVSVFSPVPHICLH